MEHAANVDHHYTTTGIDSRKLGFWVLIGSESLFFGSLIATYMVYRGQSTVGPFPHGPDGLLDIPLTSVSTFILLMSSLAMVLALHAVQVNDRRRAMLWLFMTALLGAGFLGFQAYEFTHFWHEGLTLDRNLFGASFFILTGFHGAHVAVGVVWLLALMTEAWRHRLPAERALSVEIAGLYWHFVDVVWIVIFTLIYLIE